MKLSIVALSGLAAIAASQTSTGSAATATASLSPEASCAETCASSDVCCKAKCYKVPCPDASMANDTTACVAACPQGNGSPADTDRFASCEQSCYSSDFFPATAFTGQATGTAASASATETGSGSTATGSSGSESGTAENTGSSSTGSASSTASGSSASASHTGAASQIGVQLGSAGIVGAIVAAIVL